MRILIIHRYFYPDTSTYAYLLYKLANNFKEYFTQVDVLTTMPSYYGCSKLNPKRKESLDNIYIRRLKLLNEKGRKISLRVINSLLFATYVFIKILFSGKKYEYVQVATTPPVIVALAAVLASKFSKVKVVYHCQDIYPEIIFLYKKPKGIKHMFMLLLKKVDAFIMRNTHRIVVLSEDMGELLSKNRGIIDTKIHVINNFIFERQKETKTEIQIPNKIQEIINKKKDIIVFAGNLGTFQNLDVLFDAVIKTFKSKSCSFLVIGEGIYKNTLEKKYTHEDIHFVGYLSNEIIQQIYPYCKIGFAPIVKNIDKVAYPSKIISYLVSGVPIISFSSSNSEISRCVESNNFGINYSFDGEEKLITSILKLLETQTNRTQIKKQALELFGEEFAYNKWNKLYIGK